MSSRISLVELESKDFYRRTDHGHLCSWTTLSFRSTHQTGDADRGLGLELRQGSIFSLGDEVRSGDSSEGRSDRSSD